MESCQEQSFPLLLSGEAQDCQPPWPPESGNQGYPLCGLCMPFSCSKVEVEGQSSLTGFRKEVGRVLMVSFCELQEAVKEYLTSVDGAALGWGWTNAMAAFTHQP